MEVLDARDNLAAGPVALITDPNLNLNNPNNPASTAGSTFMGLRLGPVGGRIVAEVFLGLLQFDAASYLRAHPGWRPNLPTQTRRSGQSRIVDFLTFAGVDPASRGQ